MADRSQESVATDQATAVAQTVGVAAASLVAARASRVSVLIYNNGTATIYVGPSGVTVASGVPIVVGGSLEERDYTGAIFAISGTAGQDVRVWEVG